MSEKKDWFAVQLEVSSRGRDLACCPTFSARPGASTDFSNPELGVGANSIASGRASRPRMAGSLVEASALGMRMLPAQVLVTC